MYNAGSIEAAAAARTEKSDHGILNTSPTAHQPLNSPSRTKAPSVMAAAQERLRAALATDSYSKPVAAQQCMRYNSGVAAGACDTIQVLSPAVAASASHPYLSKTPDNSTRGDSGTPRTSARLGNGTPRTSARWGNGTLPAVAVGAPVVSRQELAVSPGIAQAHKATHEALLDSFFAGMRLENDSSPAAVGDLSSPVSGSEQAVPLAPLPLAANAALCQEMRKELQQQLQDIEEQIEAVRAERSLASNDLMQKGRI